MRRYSLVTVALGLIVGMVLLLHEIASWNCTQNINEHSSTFCQTFLYGGGTCSFLAKTKKPKFSPKFTSNTVSVSRNYTMDVFEPTFSGGRTLLLSLSVIGLVCYLAALMMICYVIKVQNSYEKLKNEKTLKNFYSYDFLKFVNEVQLF